MFSFSCFLLARQLRYCPTLRQLFCAGSVVVFCCLGSCFVLPDTRCPMHTVGQISTAQLSNSTAVVFCWFGSCFLIFRQLFFDISEVVFCLGSFVILFRRLFFACSAVFLCCPTHTVSQILTSQLPNSMAVVFCLFGRCFLIVRQSFFDISAVVFCLIGSYFPGSAVVLCCPTHAVGQISIAYLPNPTPIVFCWFSSYFLIVRQLLFNISAVVFCRVGSCFWLVRQLFCAARRTQWVKIYLLNCPFVTFWQLFFDILTVLCWFGSCVLLFRQLFVLPDAHSRSNFNCPTLRHVRQLFVASAVVFSWFDSCFVLPDAHSRSSFNCPTFQLNGSCFFLVRQ